MRSTCRHLALLASLLYAFAGFAQNETIYMSVLSSRKHRINAVDNPVVGLYTSTDRGRTWSHRGWKEYIRTFYTEAGPDGTLWSACGNGVLRSTDNGTTWRITTGWEVTEVLKVRVSAANPSLVFAATAYGVIRTTDDGENWTTVTRGFNRTFTADVCIDRRRPGHLLAAAEEGVYESSDNGTNWRLSSLRGKMVNVLLQHPVNPEEFWAGTEDHGLFRTSDGGTTWHEANNGLLHRTVYTLASSPAQPATLCVGTYGGGVYRSTDGGATWVQRSAGLNNMDIHSLLMLGGTPAVMMAGTLNGGLYQSTNEGELWEFNSQADAQVWGLSARPVKAR